MSDLFRSSFGSSSASQPGSPPQPGQYHLTGYPVRRVANIQLKNFGYEDMQARKEAIMNQVRNELALSNAQELINVRSLSAPCPGLC